MDPVTERHLSISDALPNNSHIDPHNGSVVRHNRFSRATSRDGGANMSFEDLERRFGRTGRPRSRPEPATPTWRLTGTTEDSEDTIKEYDANRQVYEDAEAHREKDKTRITFLNESAMRGWQKDIDRKSDQRPVTGISEYAAQVKF